MKQKKLYMLLGTILIVGCLVAAIGITYARYRTQWNSHMGFHAEKVGKLYLGTVDSEGTFTTEPSTWIQTENGWQMSFAVGNGVDEENYAEIDQRVHLQLVASLGAWSADSEETITLTVGDKTYTATAERITANSALYARFGDGWVFRFLDTDGNAFAGELSAEQFAYITMQLSVNAAAITDTSLLQLQVTAEIA